MHKSASLFFAVATVAALARISEAAPEASRAKDPISVVVMDPLALPLSCPCVAGYAQRNYEVLGDYLEERLGRPRLRIRFPW